jgi:AraC-like DNA-binding protein
MSNLRQTPLTIASEPFLVVRSTTVHCASQLRTTSPTAGWHRLITASSGGILVRTPAGHWSAPARSAVWVRAGERAEIETGGPTTLQIVYLRATKAAWNREGLPRETRMTLIRPLLRALLAEIEQAGALDRRVRWQAALATLLLHEMRSASVAPRELVWPRDPRAARIAAQVQADPGAAHSLPKLCRGQGVSVRTAQRLFPRETGLSFAQWRARVRFLHAAQRIGNGQKVVAVAAQCGYRSASAFVAAFTRAMGVTPGQFSR